MKLIKKTDDYTIYQKRSQRYAIKDKQKKWLNGEEKVKILMNEELLKPVAAKPKQEPAAEQSEASGES